MTDSNEMKFVYTGPSWAVSSFPVENKSTNLAKEWGIPHLNYSMHASNVLSQLPLVDKTKSLPIIWCYHEPIGCLTEATGLSNAQLIQRSDWKDVWEDCNQFCLKAINDLNRPVLLIGAHSDVVNCDYKNITVAHPSWQKFLAHQAGMSIEGNKVNVKIHDGEGFFVSTCWGAEILHRAMHEHPHLKPSIEVTNAVWNILFFWKELEKADLFSDVHPSYQGNKLFAEFLKPTVIKFLQDNQ